MNLGSDLAVALSRLRDAAQDRMVDTMEVTRLAGQTVTDPASGEVTAATEVVYRGPGRLQTFNPHESARETGGSMRVTQRFSVHFPVGSFTPRIGDMLTVLDSPHDPALAGNRYRIASVMNKTAATAIRCFVDLISTGGES